MVIDRRILVVPWNRQQFNSFVERKNKKAQHATRRDTKQLKTTAD